MSSSTISTINSEDLDTSQPDHNDNTSTTTTTTATTTATTTPQQEQRYRTAAAMMMMTTTTTTTTITPVQVPSPLCIVWETSSSSNSISSSSSPSTNSNANTNTKTTQHTLSQPSRKILRLWKDVGKRIDRSLTCVWESAVESFDYAYKYLSTSKEGRYFVERYAGAVVDLLISQVPTKICPMERNCVQETLLLAVLIVAADLNIQLTVANRGNTTSATSSNAITNTTICGECVLLDSVLSHIFNRKKAFNKGPRNSDDDNNNQNGGQPPNIRIRNIEKFRGCNGFNLLHMYLQARLPCCKVPSTAIVPTATVSTQQHDVTSSAASSNGFPSLETLNHILLALYDTFPSDPATSSIPDATATFDNDSNPNDPQNNSHVQQEIDTINISRVVMLYLHQLHNDELKELPTDILASTLKALQNIFDRLAATRRHECVHFYQFYRSIVLSMISSTSVPLKLNGWRQLGEMIKACINHRPPPRSFRVRDAGCTIVNGIYHFAGTVTPDGYTIPGADASYVYTVPMDAAEGAGKKITLFRCTMRSQHKWWFLSEADEEQPGTDRDIDYYQHKSEEHEKAYPPPTGWITCRSNAIDPPPTLEPIGYMVPIGNEMDTFEHHLAKWAIENEIVERVLADITIHSEVVATSTVLIQFLAFMRTRTYRVVNLYPSITTGSMTTTTLATSVVAMNRSYRTRDSSFDATGETPSERLPVNWIGEITSTEQQHDQQGRDYCIKWWSNKKVYEMGTIKKEPLTITCDVTCLDTIILLKQEGCDMMPVLSNDGIVMGVVTVENITKCILGARCQPETTIQDSGVICNTFHRFTMYSTLHNIAKALEHDPFVLIITEHACFTSSGKNKKLKLSSDADDTSPMKVVAAVDTLSGVSVSSVLQHEQPKTANITTRSVVSGILSRIDFLDYICRGNPSTTTTKTIGEINGSTIG